MKKSNLIVLIIFSVLSVSGQDVTLNWAGSLGGSADDRGASLAIDSEGNTYTTGSFEGIADFDPDTSEFLLTSNGQDDIYVQKLDMNGNFEWAISFGGAGGLDRGKSIVVDKDGYIYVTGSFSGTVDFDPGDGSFPLTSNGGSDFFVLKLDSDANFQWAINIGGDGYEYSEFITVDELGGVYLTGSINSLSIDFDPGENTHYLSFIDGAIFILKMDSGGNFIWAKNMGGRGSAYYFTWGKAIALDNQQNVYITGVFGGTSDFDPGDNVYNLTSNGKNDVFVMKLDAVGNFVWANSVGAGGDDRGNSIKMDNANKLYVCGDFRYTVDFDPSPSIFELISEGEADIFILKLDALGNFIWAKSIGSWDYDVSNSLTIDINNDIYITGGFNNTVDFNPNSGVFNLSSLGSDDIFIEKLGSAGNFLWAVQMGGTSYERGNSMTIENSGTLYVTGTYYGTSDFDPNETNYYLTSNGSGEIFVLKLNNETMSINEMKNSSPLLYPNPSNGLVYLKNFENVSRIDLSLIHI